MEFLKYIFKPSSFYMCSVSERVNGSFHYTSKAKYGYFCLYWNSSNVKLSTFKRFLQQRMGGAFKLDAKETIFTRTTILAFVENCSNPGNVEKKTDLPSPHVLGTCGKSQFQPLPAPSKVPKEITPPYRTS